MKNAALGVAAILLAGNAARKRRLAAGLKAAKFPSEFHSAVSQATTSAALLALASGETPSRFFRACQDRYHEMARASVAFEQVASALDLDSAVIAEAIGQMPGGERERARAAAFRLYRALFRLLTLAYTATAQQHAGLLADSMAEELAARTEEELALAMVRCAVRHFAASAGAFFVKCEGVLSLVAHTGFSEPPETPYSNPKSPKGTRKLWQCSTPNGLLQLWFAGSRQVTGREARLLQLAADRCDLAILRLRQEHRLRDLSVRMLEVEELERRRIARELHDDAGQSLVVVRLQLELVEMGLPPDAEGTRASLAEIRSITEKTILGVRKLISDLSPAVLEQLGLGAAIRQLANRFQAANSMRVSLHLNELPAINRRLELVIYRVLQECFTNISRHSLAKRVNISVEASDRTLKLTVADDGIGFRVEEGLGRRNCFGLLGMRERVNLLGGELSIRSTPKGGVNDSVKHLSGTRIEAEFPLTN